MKKLVIALAALTGLTASAKSLIHFAGHFSAPHEIAMMGYESEEACAADKGRYEEGLCLFAASDDVVVSNDLKTLQVSTVATNAHSCDVEASIVRFQRLKLVAQTPSEEYDDATGEFKPATCELTVTYSADGNRVSVQDNGKCRSFCGMRATLDISGAERVPGSVF